MDLIGSLAVAFSMYSAIPMPQVEWTESRMRYALVFFPLVGAAQGAILAAFYAVCYRVGAGTLFRALIGTAIPILVTGGIHLDGFADVSDSRHSFGDREKKLQILSDPHIGAFAVIEVAVYFMLYAGALSEIMLRATDYRKGFRQMLVIAGLFVLERAMSGISVVCFPKAKNTGLAAAWAKSAARTKVRNILILWAIVSAVWILKIGRVTGILIIFAVAAVFGNYYLESRTQFGGITGDLAGWFLQRAELAGVCLVAAGNLLHV